MLKLQENQGLATSTSTTFALEGELVMESVKSFEERIRQAPKNKCHPLVLDMRGVPFVDSSGLGAIMRLTYDFEKSGRSIQLKNVNPVLRHVLANYLK